MDSRLPPIVAFAFFLLAPQIGAETPGQGVVPSLDAAIARLEVDQSIRVRTGDYLTLRGSFLFAHPDSLYLHPRSHPPETVVGVQRDNVTDLWVSGRQGTGRGLLWAGATLLAAAALSAGGAATFSEGDFMVITVITGIALPIAFYRGYMSEKEILVYSRPRDSGGR